MKERQIVSKNDSPYNQSIIFLGLIKGNYVLVNFVFFYRSMDYQSMKSILFVIDLYLLPAQKLEFQIV